MFERLWEIPEKRKDTGKLELVQLLQTHLVSLWIELHSFVPKIGEVAYKIIRTPFIVSVHLFPDNVQE